MISFVAQLIVGFIPIEGLRSMVQQRAMMSVWAEEEIERRNNTRECWECSETQFCMKFVKICECCGERREEVVWYPCMCGWATQKIVLQPPPKPELSEYHRECIAAYEELVKSGGKAW